MKRKKRSPTKKRAGKKPPKRRQRVKRLRVTFTIPTTLRVRELARASKITSIAWVRALVGQHAIATPVPAPRIETPLPMFAELVKHAARMPDVVKFHDDRAFISSVHDYLRRNGSRWPLDDFKRRLIDAHRQGLLRITRADLVGAMPRELVQRSEASYGGATFHFVAID